MTSFSSIVIVIVIVIVKNYVGAGKIYNYTDKESEVGVGQEWKFWATQ